VSAFLSKVCKLPTDWYARTRKGESILRLLDQEHPECIGPKTFDSTYRAAVSTFIERAKAEFHDQGFPLGLSVKYAKYQGTREEYEDQQRNFKAPELVRLFGSQEYQDFAKAPDMAHRYWLPLLMLYTGARPRELCQINPQVDYGVEGNIPFFLISAKTAGDTGVDKTVKTGEERHIPIHPELVRLGFLAYVDKVKNDGAKRLFPGFGCNKGDAAARAKSWFSDFLDEVGLRDETPKALISGLYAFKKTFITEAARLDLRFEPITGHADSSRSKVVRDGYIMEEVPLADKLAVLEQVVFAAKPPELGYSGP
jgi:integrase